MSDSRLGAVVRATAGLALGAFVALGCFGVDQAGTEGEEGNGAEGDVSSSGEALTGQTIDIISATYGARCGVARGNATASVAGQCDHVQNCSYFISTGTLGDPARGCDKDFDVDYACGRVSTLSSGRFSVHTPQEANGRVTNLNCAQFAATTGTILVRDATFGGNCGAPFNNVDWDVGPYCNGWGHCRYFISTGTLGDPARGCDKEFRATFSCSNNPNFNISVVAAKEANGHVVSFDCH